MNHLVLLGDSIFDNAAYVEGGPAVIEQVKQWVPSNWQASLLAVDGDTAELVYKQLLRLPPDLTHLVLSVGGNDALVCIPQLEKPVSSVKQGLVLLTKIKAEFQVRYQRLICTLLTLDKPLLVCTIYDQVPGLPAELVMALGMFNDVILREAIQNRLPVLDLRVICNEIQDYSVVSPIEPSSSGGAKLVERMVSALLRHDFTKRECHVYV